MWTDNAERICADSMRNYLRINVSTESILEKNDQEDSRIDNKVSSFTKFKLLNCKLLCIKIEKKKKFIAWWTTIKWFYNNEEKFIKLKKKLFENRRKKRFIKNIFTRKQ
jgi:hypothetical protein